MPRCALPTLLCPLRQENPHDSGAHNGLTPPLSLTDALQTLIVTYETHGEDDYVLQPSGVSGSQQTVTIQPGNTNSVGILRSLTVETTPEMVAVASNQAAVNLAAFGRTGTASFLLTREWLRANLVGEIPVLVGWENVLSLTFTNRSNYEVSLRVVYILGIANARDARDVVDMYHPGKIGL